MVIKIFIKKNIKFILGFILGGLIFGSVVYATNEILFASSAVSFDNTKANLKNSHGDSVTTVEEAIDALKARGACPVGYKEVSMGYAITCRKAQAPICKRATTLHTETCNQGANNNSYFCYYDGYYVGGTKNTTTITYGKLGISGQTPQAGDAFDCDVNKDGQYDPETERFYYVSDYFDTNTQSFDNTRAALIYYRHFVDGAASDNGVAYYASVNENWHGPTTAIAALPVAAASPTGNQWRNDLLKTDDRKISSCNNPICTTLSDKTNNGSTQINTGNTPIYQGKAARLLHLKEFVAGCGTMNYVQGELVGCNFIMERTLYANPSDYPTYGPWFENPEASLSASAWLISAHSRSVGNYYTSRTNRGVRPTIDILYTDIEY